MRARPQKSPNATCADCFLFATFSFQQKKSSLIFKEKLRLILETIYGNLSKIALFNAP